MSTPTRRREPLTILLAEADEDLRSLLSMVLRRDGHRVVGIGDGHRLRAELAMRSGPGVDFRRERLLVIADIRLPAAGGLAVIRGFTSGAAPPFIVTTAYPDEVIVAQARALGALAVFDKPFDFEDLREAVRAASAVSSPN